MGVQDSTKGQKSISIRGMWPEEWSVNASRSDSSGTHQLEDRFLHHINRADRGRFLQDDRGHPRPKLSGRMALEHRHAAVSLHLQPSTAPQ
jgi:hypothetical protein